MVATSAVLDQIQTAALDLLDSYSHIAVGTGTDNPAPSDTALTTEVLRKTFEDTLKDTVNGTYLFEMRVALTEANGNTLSEVGVFDASSGGNMATRNLLDPTVAKNEDIELVIDVEVTIEAVNT